MAWIIAIIMLRHVQYLLQQSGHWHFHLRNCQLWASSFCCTLSNQGLLCIDQRAFVVFYPTSFCCTLTNQLLLYIDQPAFVVHWPTSFCCTLTKEASGLQESSLKHLNIFIKEQNEKNLLFPHLLPISTDTTRPSCVSCIIGLNP